MYFHYHLSKTFFLCFYTLTAIIGGNLSRSYSQGDFLVFPKRLVFEGTQKRVKTINLQNTGNDTVTYRISHVEMTMNPDGKLMVVNDSVPFTRKASTYLRIYPRTVTLGPKESQLIKLQLIRTNELQAGEYRSHLYIRRMLDDERIEDSEIENEATNNFKISLTPVYGLSIANIIRIGVPDVKIDLRNISLSHDGNNNAILSLEVIREGNYSSYGDIVITHISNKGKEIKVATIKGFAVYIPGNVRKTKIKLSTSEGVDYSSGKLIIKYNSDNPKKNYATTEFPLK